MLILLGGIIVLLLLYIGFLHYQLARKKNLPNNGTHIIIPIHSLTSHQYATLHQIHQLTQEFQLQSVTSDSSQKNNIVALLEDLKHKFSILDAGIEYQQKLLDCFVSYWNHSSNLTKEKEHLILQQLQQVYLVQAKEMWRQIEKSEQEYKLGQQQVEKLEQIWAFVMNKLAQPSQQQQQPVQQQLVQKKYKYKEDEKAEVDLFAAAVPKLSLPKLTSSPIKPVTTPIKLEIHKKQLTESPNKEDDWP